MVVCSLIFSVLVFWRRTSISINFNVQIRLPWNCYSMLAFVRTRCIHAAIACSDVQSIQRDHANRHEYWECKRESEIKEWNFWKSMDRMSAKIALLIIQLLCSNGRNMMRCIKCMSRIIAELKMVSNCTVCTLNFCCLSANNFEDEHVWTVFKNE